MYVFLLFAYIYNIQVCYEAYREPGALVAGGAVNVATRSTCAASCRPDGDQCTDCRLAINGLRYSGDWRYTGPTAGGWLRIVFDQTYDVSSVYLVLPFYQENRQFKDIKLTFSDGSEHTVITDQNVCNNNKFLMST